MLMLRWQTLVGIILGLVGGAGILALTRSPQPTGTPCGPILSECDGHLRELVLHYEPTAKAIVAPIYRDFLRALDHEVTVHLVCPDRAAFDDFTATMDHVPCRISPILAGHPITAWSRDRWVALTPAAPGSATTLWSPRGEAGNEVWPARAGDERVGRDIAAALAPSVRARRSNLYFDGGDFLADGETVFVVPRVLQRNIQQTVRSREEFLGILSRELKRRVILARRGARSSCGDVHGLGGRQDHARSRPRPGAGPGLRRNGAARSRRDQRLHGAAGRPGFQRANATPLRRRCRPMRSRPATRWSGSRWCPRGTGGPT